MPAGTEMISRLEHTLLCQNIAVVHVFHIGVHQLYDSDHFLLITVQIHGFTGTTQMTDLIR